MFDGISVRISEDQANLIGADLTDLFVRTFDIYVNLTREEVWTGHERVALQADSLTFAALAAITTRRPGIPWHNAEIIARMVKFYPGPWEPQKDATWIFNRLRRDRSNGTIERIPARRGYSRILTGMRVCLVCRRSQYVDAMGVTVPFPSVD